MRYVVIQTQQEIDFSDFERFLEKLSEFIKNNQIDKIAKGMCLDQVTFYRGVKAVFIAPKIGIDRWKQISKVIKNLDNFTQKNENSWEKIE